MKSLRIVLVFSIFMILTKISIAQIVPLGEIELTLNLMSDYDVIEEGTADYKVVCDKIEIDFYTFDTATDACECDEEDIALWVIELAEYRLNCDIDRQIHLIDYGQMEGAWVECKKNNDHFILLGLIDSESKKNYYAIIHYEDVDEAEDEAIRIIRSMQFNLSK